MVGVVSRGPLLGVLEVVVVGHGRSSSCRGVVVHGGGERGRWGEVGQPCSAAAALCVVALVLLVAPTTRVVVQQAVVVGRVEGGWEGAAGLRLDAVSRFFRVPRRKLELLQ